LENDKLVCGLQQGIKKGALSLSNGIFSLNLLICHNFDTNLQDSSSYQANNWVPHNTPNS
jgi:hypothetical protein